MNQELFLWLNALGESVPSTLWVHLTNLGDASVALAILVGFYQYPKDRGVPILIIALLTTVIVQGGKHYFGLERPPALLSVDAFNLIGAPISTHSFPSGHTATAFVCAGILCAQYSRPTISALLIAVASLVGLSRIMIGVHWPLDVFVGAVIGWILGFYGYRILSTRIPVSTFFEFVAFGILLVVLVNQYLYSMPYAEFDGVDASKALFTAIAAIGVVRFLLSSAVLRGKRLT